MGKPTGFMEIARKERKYQPVEIRVKNFDEFTSFLDLTPNIEILKKRASKIDMAIKLYLT